MSGRTALQCSGHEGEHQGGGGEGGADPVGSGPAEPGGDHEPAEPGGEGVAEVEGADVDGGGQGGRSGGLVEDPLLERGHGREAEGADQYDGDGGAGLGVGGEGEDGEGDGEGAQGHVEHGHEGAVGVAPADEVAGDHAEAEEDEQPGDGGVREAGDFGHHRRDVGDGGEDTAEAEDGHGHREQDLDVAEGGELAADAHSALGPGQVGHQAGDAEQAGDTERSDDHEGDAPADGLSDEGAERDADDVGHGQPGEHHGDRAGLLLGGDELGGDDRADAEERAVGERGDDAAGEHDAEGGGECGEHVARDEEAHEQHQHALAGDAGAEHGHEGGAQDDAEGVAGDEEARGGDRDAVVGGDLGEQAHDHEFGGADPEGPDGEGEKCERHGEVPFREVVVRMRPALIDAAAVYVRPH